MRAYGSTNDDNRYYKFRVVGDSPELSPLDNHLFSDLENAINLHVAISSFIPDHNDARCFYLGTPHQVQSTMFRCWKMEPTSERIVSDVMKLHKTLQAIVTADGVVVENDSLRNDAVVVPE